MFKVGTIVIELEAGAAMRAEVEAALALAVVPLEFNVD
jgi:hypothetical protein